MCKITRDCQYRFVSRSRSVLTSTRRDRGAPREVVMVLYQDSGLLPLGARVAPLRIATHEPGSSMRFGNAVLIPCHLRRFSMSRVLFRFVASCQTNDCSLPQFTSKSITAGTRKPGDADYPTGTFTVVVQQMLIVVVLQCGFAAVASVTFGSAVTVHLRQ